MQDFVYIRFVWLEIIKIRVDKFVPERGSVNVDRVMYNATYRDLEVEKGIPATALANTRNTLYSLLRHEEKYVRRRAHSTVDIWPRTGQSKVPSRMIEHA